MTYKVGDKVRVISKFRRGVTGTICHIYNMNLKEESWSIGVRHDIPKDVEYHTCDKHCESDRGWFYTVDDLKLDIIDDWSEELK